MTQLLHSDAIAGFPAQPPGPPNTDPRFCCVRLVPKVEHLHRLINWLIQTRETPQAEFIGAQAVGWQNSTAAPAHGRLVQGSDGVVPICGFLLSIHLEATAGVSVALFETFAKCYYWSPAEPGKPDRWLAGHQRSTVGKAVRSIHASTATTPAAERGDAQPDAGP